MPTSGGLQPGVVEDPRPSTTGVLDLKWDAVVQGESRRVRGLSRPAIGMLVAHRKFSAPAQNFVTRCEGNIGYAMSGLSALRNGFMARAGSGCPTMRGWRGLWPSITTRRHESATPFWLIVTANNEVDGEDDRSYDIRLGPAVSRPANMEILTDAHGRSDDMARIQGDVTSTSADRILKHVEVPADVRELSGWDRHVDARPVVALYEVFEEALWRRTFADEMPSSLYDRFYRYAGNERFAGLHAILTEAESPWFDDRRTPDVIERRADIARRRPPRLSSLRGRLGPVELEMEGHHE